MTLRRSSILIHLALTLGSLVLAVLLAEVALGWIGEGGRWDVVNPRARAARKAGVGFDPRGRLEVVLDHRKLDANWYPAIPANAYLDTPLTLHGERVVPLGGVADANVVGCNEGGYYSTFRTDDFGFPNASETWTRGPSRKVFFVGDSFTEGECLQPGETPVDRVREHVPGVVDLGNGGNGPLQELAAIREYVPADGVSLVFWMYYEENDLADLERDEDDPLLSRYLDAGFSQGLRARQGEINAAVRASVEERLEAQLAGRPVILPNLRKTLWHARHRSRTGAPTAVRHVRSDLDLFERVLVTAKSEVESKGGRLAFVYLPEYFRYDGSPESETVRLHDEVVAVAVRHGIDVIDLVPVLAKAPDPLALFPFRMYGHYNETGASLVAAHIRDYLGARSR